MLCSDSFRRWSIVKYEDIGRHLVHHLVENNEWYRAVSIDAEVDLRVLDDPERIPLSVSLARRVDQQIEVRKFVLNEETREDEARLLGELGTAFQSIRPLLLIGFNINTFDKPVLALKLRQLDNTFKKEGKRHPWYWALRDAIGRSHVLDIIDSTRFEIAEHDGKNPSFVQLEDAINHPRFRHLPFKNTKHIVSSRMTADPYSKWDVIHDLWQNDRRLFEQYIEGDVHDTLLIAEDLFCRK